MNPRSTDCEADALTATPRHSGVKVDVAHIIRFRTFFIRFFLFFVRFCKFFFSQALLCGKFHPLKYLYKVLHRTSYGVNIRFYTEITFLYLLSTKTFALLVDTFASE